MQWREIGWRSKPAGLISESDKLILFFGFGDFAKDDLGLLFPEFQFFHLKQVHGPVLIEASHDTKIADAHFSLNPREALVIQTADCLPVLIGGHNFALAAHAGWRGIANGLLSSCSKWIAEQKFEPQRIAIGPHIRAEHFEVGLDVADQLHLAAQQVNPQLDPRLPHLTKEKSYVDLLSIAKEQIQAGLGPSSTEVPTIEDLKMSTFADTRFQSFRRGTSGQARQYSFIARR